MGPMIRDFAGRIEQFAQHNDVPILPFEKGRRKDDVAKERFQHFEAREGVVFIEKAREKC